MAEIPHRIKFGQGDQPLRHVPIDKHGHRRLVTTATYAIVDLTYSEGSTDRTVDSGTAAIGAATTTLSGAAGPGQAFPTRIPVADETGFAVNRRYILVGADGKLEVVRVARIDAANNRIYAARSLMQDFVTGDTFRTVELEATFPSAVADDDSRTVDVDGDDFQVTWTYTLDDDTQVVPQPIMVERYDAVIWVTKDDLARRHPEIVDRSEESDIADAIVAATEDLSAELEAVGLTLENYRTGDYGRVMVALMALEHLARGYKGTQDREDAERWRSQWLNMLRNMLSRDAPRHSKVLSRSSDEAVAGAERADTWVRG